MQIPPTQRVSDELEKNDSFLHALMGLINSIPQFDLLLARLSRPSTNSSLERSDALSPLEVLLGAIAVRRCVSAHLERILTAPRAASDSSVQPPTMAARGLLR